MPRRLRLVVIRPWRGVPREGEAGIKVVLPLAARCHLGMSLLIQSEHSLKKVGCDFFTET